MLPPPVSRACTLSCRARCRAASVGTGWQEIKEEAAAKEIVWQTADEIRLPVLQPRAVVRCYHVRVTMVSMYARAEPLCACEVPFLAVGASADARTKRACAGAYKCLLYVCVCVCECMYVHVHVRVLVLLVVVVCGICLSLSRSMRTCVYRRDIYVHVCPPCFQTNRNQEKKIGAIKCRTCGEDYQTKVHCT